MGFMDDASDAAKNAKENLEKKADKLDDKAHELKVKAELEKIWQNTIPTRSSMQANAPKLLS